MYGHERSLAGQLSGNSFAIIGVNSDRDLAAIRKTVVEKDITWRSFWNGPEGPRGPISKQWNVSNWPTVFVLDPKGVIRFRDPHGDKLDETITELLAEIGEEVTIKHEE